ncbi:MAG TPA: hypothetical protein VHV27_09950, partial [Phenylobacterium sp.]|nr:hypothetical protein [Phenylobacterium sp.]
TAADIADAQVQRKYVFLWGWAAYNDAFEGTKRHLTHFCYVLIPVGDGSKRDPNAVRWDYVQSPQGNYFKDLE